MLPGRNHVVPDDIARLAHRVLRHRLILGFEAASLQSHPRRDRRRGAARGAGAVRRMGKHLDSAKAYFGRDTTGLLEGGRYALVHTRSLEFDDLRPYVPGDDVRDIDWKASARSGQVLIKRFVSEKHHKILVVADAGRNTTAHAPSGERKRDVAAHFIGAIGLITLRRSDEIGMVFGDVRGCVDIRLAARRDRTSRACCTASITTPPRARHRATSSAN